MFQEVGICGPSICPGILPFGSPLGSYGTATIDPSSDTNLLMITNPKGNTLISRKVINPG